MRRLVSDRPPLTTGRVTDTTASPTSFMSVKRRKQFISSLQQRELNVSL